MARGSKDKYSGKQKRQAEHIAEGYAKRGTSKKEAKRRAWATVNEQSGGGEKSGSGRGKPTSQASSRKGGKKTAKKTSAKKTGKKKTGKKKTGKKKTGKKTTGKKTTTSRRRKTTKKRGTRSRSHGGR